MSAASPSHGEPRASAGRCRWYAASNGTLTSPANTPTPRQSANGTGGAPAASTETDAAEFFPVHRLPPLSTGRVLATQIERLEVMRAMFYQTSRAYIVGRIQGRGFLVPLVIALKNTDSGVLVDAVMLAEADVSIVFSFTRSYFHADLERVAEAVVFLRSLMPRKPVSELFTVLGRARQGKTERYRELMRNLAQTQDCSSTRPASADW